MSETKGLFRENGEESRNNLKQEIYVFNTNRKANGHIGMVTRVDRVPAAGLWQSIPLKEIQAIRFQKELILSPIAVFQDL